MPTLKEIRQRLGWAEDQLLNFLERAGGVAAEPPPTDSALHHVRTARAGLEGHIGTEDTSEDDAEPTGDLDGLPAPGDGAAILYDMRAGGEHDLQAGAVATIEEAESQCGLKAVDVERCAEPADGVWGVTNDFLGDGTRAFVAPWIENAGADGCYGNGCPPDGSQQNLFLELGGGYFGSIGPGDVVYVQHKRRFGRTALDTSPQAVGDVDVFTHTHGGRGRKMFIWNRPNAPERVNWMTRGTADGKAFFLEVEQDHWLNTGEGDGETEIKPWWPNAYSPGGPYTFTIRIRLESAEGVGDGEVSYWVDDQLIAEHVGVHTYTDGFGNLEVGGPTWICPPQNQTEYFWDLVVWKEGS